MESQELYVRWQQDIHVWIYTNFPAKQARDNLIAQLLEGQAKVIYDNCTQEILEDTQYDRAAQQSDENYDIHKKSDWRMQWTRSATIYLGQEQREATY